MAFLGRDQHKKEDLDESLFSNLERLAALNATRAMGAPPRAELDDLTRAAAGRLGTPLAFMSLVDDRRVFFASSYGQETDAARENKREASYCQNVVTLDDVLVVDDSTEVPLVADHIATTRDGVRAYLGVPIRKDGHCLGSFCVVDTEPREWTDGDLAVLQQLADQATATL